MILLLLILIVLLLCLDREPFSVGDFKPTGGYLDERPEAITSDINDAISKRDNLLYGKRVKYLILKKDMADRLATKA